MKYGLDYFPEFKYKDKIDELILTPGTWEQFNFEEYPNCRFILDISRSSTDIDEVIYLLQLKKDNINEVAIKLLFQQEEIAKELKSRSISFFFSQYAGTLDMFKSFIDYGVSDIYIANELGFNIKRLSEYAHMHDVKIRVYPNVSQTNAPLHNLDLLKGFFIRPEDIKFYEDVVDICELAWVDEKIKLNTVYEVYAVDKEWNYLVSTLISGLDENISNNCFPPNFGKTRLNCEKKCQYDKCMYCNRIRDLANTLKENNIEFKKDNIDD